ncbi:MAG: peptidylprolyl isomerase [Alloprevotella sp.]|nr:peptidylprolyl isomerase [Alloprevotella sp.]
MDSKNHQYISVAYKLYTFSADETPELVEEATAEQPFQFISNLGVALDSFEAKVSLLDSGTDFDFELSPEEAYGNYEEQHVVQLNKSDFEIDGHENHIDLKVGNIIPLVNNDGLRFNGEIIEIGEQKVTIDLNHPLAGYSLHFIGKVIENRPATENEIEAMQHIMSGEDCCCGCHDDEGHCHHHEGDCCHHDKEDHHHCHHD